MANKIYGYFDELRSDAPAFDPGLNVSCPFCSEALNYPHQQITAINFSALGGKPSYFYRAHTDCYWTADSQKIRDIESVVIDGVH